MATRRRFARLQSSRQRLLAPHGQEYGGNLPTRREGNPYARLHSQDPCRSTSLLRGSDSTSQRVVPARRGILKQEFLHACKGRTSLIMPIRFPSLSRKKVIHRS